VISVDLFYRYPYTTDAIRRRIEMLEEKIFYISLDGEPKMMTDMTWGRRIRKNEIKIDPQDIFRLMKEISRHMPETAKEDLNRLVEKLERYNRYAEC
jgi:replicative DNA helicase